MRCHPGTKTVASAEALKNAWWKELLSKLNDFQGALWCEWGWLDNDRVPRHQSRSNLSDERLNWEVPWNNGTNDAQRGVS